MTEQKNVASTSIEIFNLLQPYSPEERNRIIQATLLLLGGTAVATNNTSENIQPFGVSEIYTDAKGFFDAKDPKNKGEELAVAARYLEKKSGLTDLSKADFKNVFAEARRNFDDSHFTRDMDNAKRQAGFFISGTGRNINKLSYNGQNFVDALPDRNAASKLKRKKTKGAKKVAQKTVIKTVKKKSVITN